MPDIQSLPDHPSAEALISAMRQLPPTARVLARLQKLLADPNSGLDDVAEIIRLDASLTTRVIQISNSVWFGRGIPCRTIEDAVNRVGFREIYRLVAVVASGAMVAGALTSYGRTADIIWDESVSCGVACELIAELTGEDSSVAYTAGLLHLIGRTPIDYFIQTKTPDRKLPEEGFPLEFSGAEFALLGYTQAEVGACMLNRWDFTPLVSEPIRRQYDPLDAEEPYDRIAAILFGGRLMRTVFLGNEELGEIAGEADILGTLHLTRQDLLNLREKMEDELVRVHQITKG
jgi:HD-like signal output (HDOD) protein